MNYQITYFLSFLSVFFCAGKGFAQEHPFLSAYLLTEVPSGVLVNWTINGGSTCNGQDVERSSDSVNFVAVHRIQGICGSSESAFPYTWIDPAPPEFSKLYYRIKLGYDGYSSVKSLFFEQLKESDHRFFPNPARDEATLVMNIPLNSTFDLRIRDSSGMLVMEQRHHRGPSVKLALQELRAGTYIYQATSGARGFSGRFVKE